MIKPKMIRRIPLSISSASTWLLFLQVLGCLTVAIPEPPKNRDPPCTGSWNWLGSGMVTSDCTAAIQKFFAVDVSRYGYRDFEFRSQHKKRKTPLLQMETPRRYIVGTCTLVIAMLEIFPLMDLPEPPKGPFLPSDISTFYDLHTAAINIHENCVSLLHQAGYQEMGMVKSVGVFLMATNSPEDRYIPRGVTPTSRGLNAADNLNQNNSLPSTDTA